MSDFSSDPESGPSFQTESESEHESVWGEEKDQKEIDYTTAAKDIICEDVNITTENALKLNSGYHNMLKVLKNKLEILLAHCQERQVEIEKQIDEYRISKKPLTGKARTSGYICGQPYFKDEDLYPGPHNDDYLYRKNVKKEFFPLDLFEVTDTNWTVKDKINILKGVKTQIVEFIEMENRLKIKKIGNGLEAERLRREIASLKGMDINDLWNKVKNFHNEYPGQNFGIDWLRISNANISGRHSVEACIGIWNNYMLPGLVRDAWKTEEESLLLEAVEVHRRQDWHAIAESVPGRSPYQCFVHYQTTFSDLAQIKHDRWTDKEDALLVRLVEENRIGSNIVWNKVVEKMPLRNKIQCYNRYMFTLMRPTKNAKFTPEEDCIITAYVQQYGDDFRFVPPNLLPGRSNRQIWARYNQTLKYVKKHSGWTIEEDMRLMNFIKENLTDEGPRKISWAACSKVLGNHSRLSCRTRYYTIEKFLEKNPNATLDDVPRKDKKLSTQVTNDNWMRTIIDIRNEPKVDEPSELEQPSTSATPVSKVQKKSRKLSNVTLSKNGRPFSSTLKCVFKKQFYEKMKYSFHYCFNEQTEITDNYRVFCNNKIIFMLLNCVVSPEKINSFSELTPAEKTHLQSSITIQINPCWVNFLRSAMYCFLFPPNYNTMLGLRGVVLNATYPKEETSSLEIKQECTDEVGYNHALDTFRDRFRMLFTWTMLLVRQNPREADFRKDPVHTNSQAEMPCELYDFSAKMIEEQLSLEQLSKLHNSPRLPYKRIQKPTGDQPVYETTVCLDQLDLYGRPYQDQATEDKIDMVSNQTISNPPQPEPVIIPESGTSLKAGDINFTSQPLPDYNNVHYNLVLTQTPNIESTIHSTMSDQLLPFTNKVEHTTNHMDLVKQITVIDPEHLPVARAPIESSEQFALPQPPSQTAIALCAESIQMAVGGDGKVDEHAIGDETYPSETDNNGSDYESDDPQPQPAAEVLSGVEPEANAISEALVDSTVTTTSSETNSIAADTTADSDTKENETDNESLSLADLSHVTHVSTVSDYVIEKLEEPTIVDSPKLLDEPLDLHIGNVRSKQQEEELSLKSNEPSLFCSESDLGDSSESTANAESPSRLESDDHEELVKVPRKTYGRVSRGPSKQKDNEISRNKSDRWWRWVHVDETNPDDVNLHRELWEMSDPFRERFRQLRLPECDEKKDEIIVIDDDEVEIKEEPPELQETEQVVNKVEDTNDDTVDESCIQQIIQTASNILRITETYKLLNPNPEPAYSDFSQPHSEQAVQDFSTMRKSGSLIVQTPSRIFDEQTNCYYYVDEIKEDCTNDVDAPVVEIPQLTPDRPMQSNLDEILESSLSMTYQNVPEFEAPRRVLTLPRETTPTTESFQAYPLHTIPLILPNTYSRKKIKNLPPSKSQQIESRIMEHPASEVPKRRQPKRPPRDQTKISPEQQEQALSLLDALYRKPRLPPIAVNKSPTSATMVDRETDKCVLTSTSAITNHIPKNTPLCTLGQSPKRPPSKSPEKRPTKRNKICRRILSPADIKPEFNHDEFLERLDESIDAVDFIDALNRMNRRVKVEEKEYEDDDDDDHYDDDDDDDCSNDEQHHSNVEDRLTEEDSDYIDRTPLTSESSKRGMAPKQTSSTVTQQMVKTIIESTTGRPSMDVHFKIAGITIKKVQHK
ncbi:uncharacterized protein LOC131428184 [Malaya genurostris]|uniref:uncharacterized protein LOC131428184 n=1 Tax=Malaya genurostris TaxID=325434 RepID=UPI0026F3C4B7|nr:uncharacterized protein LOC131428184 [Malaya genurostris]